MENPSAILRFLENSGKGLLNFGEGLAQVSEFILEEPLSWIGFYLPRRESPPQVEGGEIVQRVGNVVGAVEVLPGLVLSGLEGAGGIVGGIQALRGTGVAIGTLEFTSASAAAGYGTLSVPGVLYSGPQGAAQTMFSVTAGVRNVVTGAPIVLGPSGDITAFYEVPTMLGLGARITNLGGPFF